VPSKFVNEKKVERENEEEEGRGGARARVGLHLRLARDVRLRQLRRRASTPRTPHGRQRADLCGDAPHHTLFGAEDDEDRRSPSLLAL